MGAELRATWLTHWEQAEAQEQFRRQVFASTRGRQAQRRQWLLDVISEAATASPDQAAAARAASGAGPAAAVGYDYSCGSDGPDASDDDMDELTWLATHPEAERPPEGAAAAPAGWAERAGAAGPAAGAVQLCIGGECVAVRPLWIAVHQPEGGGGAAHLYESIVPLDDEVAQHPDFALLPFHSVSSLEFGAFADVRRGAWANFFVGVVGEVAVEEHEILWPNSLLHRDRVLYNVRHGDDVARFLADPRRADVESHLANLLRLAEERRYRRGWAWHMLCMRWGRAALDGLGVTIP